MSYCLIGEKLGHSFSKEIHNKRGLSYELVEIERQNLKEFVKNCKYKGFNVTIPYKQEIMPYLDDIESWAQEIGAVNTVVNENGKWKGYNTDILGMEKMVELNGISLSNKSVMILGSGGTSKTAQALCKKLGVKNVSVVSRSGEINYENCYEKTDTQVIINTTPVGMYPNNQQTPIDLEKFANLVAVFDCVYNPLKTRLISKAKSLNLICCNGLYMLVAQALYAQSLWLKTEFTNSDIENILGEIIKEKRNIVLSGMPACGKTTIGKILAQKLNRQFVDTDELVSIKTGKTIPEIINEQGEKAFRDIESDVIKEVSATNGKVIALGGGVPLREENRINLKQNGLIVYIKRDLSFLVSNNRPLSQRKGVQQIYQERKEIYEKFADITVENNEIETAVKEIINYENFSN